MNIWIVTIGSSDVQLDSDSECRKKDRNEQQRSDKIWRYWYEDEIKPDCHDISFEPKQSYKDKDEPYRIEARILGTVYEESSSIIRDEIWSYLTFPLLDNFVGELENSSPDAIAVLLTDQSEIFQDKNTRGKQKCAYWQDTCKLEPILQRYFQDKFPQAKYKPIFLAPTSSDKGLDDWNYVLDLVREKLRAIEFDGEEIKNEEIETVYVSHQAGTPAISSAVQFVSLARFRNNVEFLVSNEYNQETDKIPRSTYLGAIQMQEAQALLKRHDYAGVRDILGLTKTIPSNPEEKRIKHLLDAGEQWNFAEFQKFKKIVNDRNLLPKASFPWWRLGFESAYLAWVRLEQGSPVDAMFHSFRAVEGSAGLWAERMYQNHIRRDPKKGLQLNLSICDSINNMKSWFEKGKTGKYKQEIGLYGKCLFSLLRETNTNWQSNRNIALFCNPLDQYYQGKDIFQERNNLFHRLEGLQEQEIYDAWDAANKDEWIEIVLGCLNFIAEKDIPNKLESLKEASLMFKVHQELVNAIAPNNLQR
ncbi:hypothetical protein QT995_16870 [Microcoleus sp. S36b_A3]|uniref:hypothetical protein n=1 Tax=unclassified Microcoleus TaxID=2642155 RepID=UPI002FD2ADC2